MSKKNTLVILMVAIGTAHAFGQSFFNKALLNNYSISQQKARSAGKTTATSSRLISETGYTYNGSSYIPTDSVAIFYSGTHGGDLTHRLKADVAYYFSYNAATSGYVYFQKVENTFDGNDNISAQLLQRWDAVSGSFRDDQLQTFTFDGMNNILTNIFQQWDSAANAWVNDVKATGTYDASNNRTRSLTQRWDATMSSWVDNTSEQYTYTATNKIATDILIQWDATTSYWDSLSKTIYSYDASDNLIKVINQQWSVVSNNWVNEMLDSFTYDIMSDQLSALEQTWNTTTSSWDNSVKKSFSNFTGQQPQLEIDQQWDATTSAFVNAAQIIKTYNSFNQLTYEYSNEWDTAGGGTWVLAAMDNAQRFGYESYNTKVQNVVSAGGIAEVYPVPAKNMLSISVTWDMPQAFSVSIIDVQGRLVRQWEVPVALDYNNTIPVADLIAGNYFLKIDGSDGSIVKKLTITN